MTTAWRFFPFPASRQNIGPELRLAVGLDKYILENPSSQGYIIFEFCEFENRFFFLYRICSVDKK